MSILLPSSFGEVTVPSNLVPDDQIANGAFGPAHSMSARDHDHVVYVKYVKSIYYIILARPNVVPSGTKCAKSGI